MKNFFDEAKRNLKFKMAGPGHKLSDDTSQPSGEPSGSQNSQNDKRVDSIENQEKRSAVLAAVMQRTLGKTKTNEIPKRKIKSEDAAITPTPGTSSPRQESLPKEDIVEGVYFKCPTLDTELTATASQWKALLEKNISLLKTVDPLEAAAVTIKSCNTAKKAEGCIFIICKYLNNLKEHPDNEKYKSIRMSNPKFTEHVLNVKGGLEFLESVGFVKESRDDEDYLIYKPESPDDLDRADTVLIAACDHPLILHRDLKFIRCEDIGSDIGELPDDFFDLTAAELKKEQKSRTSKLEIENTLMTRKMREMINPGYRKRKPLYTCIRVRLFEDLIIQGTFSVEEKFKNLRKFLEDEIDILDPNYNFILTPSMALGPEEEEKTFAELDLQPAVYLTLNIPADKIAFKSKT